MKLALADQEGICILTGTESISVHDLQILRAGLTKLLKSGKNRIVVDLPEADKIPPDMLREIAKFDALARELSGRIILAGISKKLLAQIESFSKPPVIECVEGRAAALAKFKEKAKEPPPHDDEGEGEPAGSKAAAEKANAASDALKAANEAVLKIKQELRSKELADSELKKSAERMKTEIAHLTEQLHAAVMGRRNAANEAAHQSKVRELEQEIEALLKDREDAKAAAAAPAPAGKK
jgi:hypothetical protein